MLKLSFYQQGTALVARELLGQILCRRLPDGRILKGRIVETEAYLGLADKACHTHGGINSSRTAPMWQAGGIAYVYLIYGMYSCFNVVSRKAGQPEAVLIRALQPVSGHEDFQRLFPRLKSHQWLQGPGRLCRGFQIDRGLSGASLLGPDLWIEKASSLKANQVGKSVRINVDYAGEWALKPLRFFEKGNPCVSGPRTLNGPMEKSKKPASRSVKSKPLQSRRSSAPAKKSSAPLVNEKPASGLKPGKPPSKRLK